MLQEPTWDIESLVGNRARRGSTVFSTRLVRALERDAGRRGRPRRRVPLVVVNIPHFIHVPGYVYAYPFGFLLATSVYGAYEKRGPEFVPSYLEMLTAGGSKSPEELALIVGCDLTDESFWDQGLDMIARDMQAAEEAAREAGLLT